MGNPDAFEQLVVNAGLRFAHSPTLSKIAHAPEDIAAFVGSLIGSVSGDPMAGLETLESDIDNRSDRMNSALNALVAALTKAKTDLQSKGISIPAAKENGPVQVAVPFDYLLETVDTAVEVVATRAAGNPNNQAVYDGIVGIRNPMATIIADPLNNAGNSIALGLDTFANKVLGWNNATAKLATSVKWDKNKKEPTAELASVSNSHPQLPGFSFDGATLEGFLLMPSRAKAGLRLRGVLLPALRANPITEAIIPGVAETAAETPLALTLDTSDGLTTGEGKDERISTPLRIPLPRFEVRQLVVFLPQDQHRVSVTLKVAA